VVPSQLRKARVAFGLVDLAWYEAGRRRGGRTLHFLLGLPPDPEASFRKANAIVSRHGVRHLLIIVDLQGRTNATADIIASPGAVRINPLRRAQVPSRGSMITIERRQICKARILTFTTRTRPRNSVGTSNCLLRGKACSAAPRHDFTRA
jgi:hypothetical protein